MGQHREHDSFQSSKGEATDKVGHRKELNEREGVNERSIWRRVRPLLQERTENGVTECA